MYYYYTMLSISLISLFFSMMLLNNSMLMSMDMPLWTINSMNISFNLIMDWYTLIFITTVLMISSMILIFSLKYIPNNEFKQFSMIMMMFVISMLLLIMADNMIFVLLGWDGLGLSSFMLVVYYQNFSSSSSGSITIFSNRVGDIAMLISISILTITMNWNFSMNEQFPYIAIMFFIVAAISKSAQFPFSSWLPAAMAAPTPISALVHSSTLVTAGVYILIRVMSFNHPNSMAILLMTSSITTIYASVTANWEQDMKKIIALSTLSQIGMMMFIISLGSYKIAFLHLIIHALFKSLMFLCAGTMIYNFMYQDMRSMATTNNKLPTLMVIMSTSNMALMGIPFLSGFFSKDSIIEFMINSKMFSLLSIIMMFSIGLTMSYSIRMFKLSLKMTMKSKPDILLSNFIKMEFPMIMMTPFSLFLGSMLTWILAPIQLFLIPTNIKFLILFIMMSGFIMGTSMKFNKEMYLKTGMISIKMWFLNILSSHMFFNLFPIMNFNQKNDKTWQEMYGPKYMYINLTKKIFNPEIMLNFPTFLMMILFLFPATMLM